MEGTTQNQTQYINDTINTNTFMQNVKTYLGNPLYSGLMGFAALFSLILLTKVFGYILGTHETFSVGMQDVIYSLTGFVFAAGIKFLEFFGKED